MNVAIIGATGSCGRQVAEQLLERLLLPQTATLYLVGHQGGAHELELWGLRADLRDAFADRAPEIKLAVNLSGLKLDLVVMMAGATISTDPEATVDRAALGQSNFAIFNDVSSRFFNRVKIFFHIKTAAFKHFEYKTLRCSI